MRLPKELIEDYKSNVAIPELCCKYGLNRYTVRDQLMKMGIKREDTWGGKRKGCGRKKRERSSELQRIRDKNVKLKSTREGVKVRPKFKLW
ncbi:hypothetical protein KAX08_00405 [candidate division WOR-3 bacterium]|nr:hypothetical protein [candidate division WOR-3 bacterium]